jgi:hypothetical protein
MELSMRMGAFTVILECDWRFEEAGNAVLRKFVELDRKSPALKDGSRIQFGWAVLTLHSDDAGLRVYEPDYLGDALHGLNRTLDLTFEVIMEQTDVLRREGAEGLDARFDDYMTARPGAIEAADIFLMRQSSRRANYTGWFLGDLAQLEDGDTEEELEALRVFELLKRRRSAMKVLALPPGYAVVMRGDEIDSIMSG